MVHSSDCQICKKEVTKKCQALECNKCNDWYHAVCVGFPKATYKGLVLVDDSDKLGLLWFCKPCLLNIKGYIIRDNSDTSCDTPLTQTNEDSAKGLSQGSPSSDILNSKLGISTSIKSNPSTGKNDEREWRTVKNSLKQPKGAGNSKKIETRNKYSILGGLEDSIDCEVTLVGDSIIREQRDIFCNRGRKMRSRLCIPGGNVETISDAISKLGNNRGHVVAHVGTNNLVQRVEKSYGYRNIPNRNSEEIYSDFGKLIETLGKRNKKSFLVGILPRMNTSNEILGRAFSMNSRVKELCRTSKVEYIDMWDEYIGLNHLFKDDGLHLSYLGGRKYDSILKRALSDLGF